MKHLLHFKIFESTSHDDKFIIDYSELSWKMDKYMPDDEESQNEYHDILNSDKSVEEKIVELEDYFNSVMNEEQFLRYMPEGGTLRGFCKYLINNK